MQDPIVEEIRIMVPWGVIAVKCWHSRVLKPVLVAHGLNENAGAFDRLVPLLPRDFFYAVVDLPGHGFSTAFPGGVPLDFMQYVHQLRWVVNHFGWKRFTLMGHSFGGHVGEFYAATYPNQVEKLVLLEAFSPTPVSKEIYNAAYLNQMNEIIKLRNRTNREYTYDEALAMMMNGRWSKLNSSAAVALLNRCLRRTEGGYIFNSDFRTRFEVKPALGEETLLYIYGEIRCPVLVVLGEESEMKPIHGSSGFCRNVLEQLRKSHPSSRIVRVVGNHCLHNNNPEAVAPIITQFLFDEKCNL